jgi:SAM-dependent methyltransferase
MLATRQLPPAFAAWNAAHGAPFGYSPRLVRYLARFLPASAVERARGPFQYQPNNDTRAFEYPWAFQTGGARAGMDVLEIGGGLSGFQFVLARAGCRVTNVDPGMEGETFSWPVNETTIARLNKLYGTSVRLRNTVIEQAELADESFDLAFSISVLEHLPEPALAAAVRETFRVLRSGGRLVMTIDLFLNVQPFAEAATNRFGGNVNVRRLLDYAPFELEIGIESELHGFDRFTPAGVLGRLHELLVGEYPALVQCVVLRKP